MCEPTTIAYVATTVVATAMSVKAQGDAADASNAQAKYAAAQADKNAVIAEENEQRAYDAERATREEGREAEIAHARQSGAYIENQKQAMAANGVFIDGASALELTEETEMLARSDRRALARDVDRQALSMRQQGEDQANQAQNFRSRAGGLLAQSNFDPTLGQAASVMQAAGSTVGAYSQYKADGGKGFKAYKAKRAAKKSSGTLQNKPLSGLQ